MPKSSNQKLKITYIRDYFFEYSDEEHPVTVNMIIEMLANRDIKAERKSIYDDIALLRDVYGLDIVTLKRGCFYLAQRAFELAEVKLLVDTVSSSKFLTEAKSAKLITKIEGLASRYQARNFRSQVFLQNRVKTMNERIYITVDEIFTAVAEDVKIAFRYFHYNERKQRVFSKMGEKYVVSPFAMMIEGDHYYLVAYDEQSDKLRHFRVDRIENNSILKEKRVGHEKFEKADYKSAGTKMFSMYSGNAENVTLRFDNSLAGVAIDRFGKDTVLIPNDDGTFDITAQIGVSPQFYGWLFGLSGKVRVISPQNVRNDFAAELQRHLDIYNDLTTEE